MGPTKTISVAIHMENLDFIWRTSFSSKAKDTVSRYIAGRDVGLYLLQHLEVSQAQRPRDGYILVTFPVSQRVVRVRGAKQHQGNLILRLGKHLQ